MAKEEVKFTLTPLINSENTKTNLVYITKSILNENADISVVYHDEDGDWQVLDETGSFEDPALISLENLISLDESIKFLLELPKGSKALKRNDSWKIV